MVRDASPMYAATGATVFDVDDLLAGFKFVFVSFVRDGLGHSPSAGLKRAHFK